MGDQPGGTGFQVETNGLTGLANEVRTENDMTLRPQATQVRANFIQGVPFGAASASEYVFTAKERYRSALLAGMQTLTDYVEAAEVLSSAAERVAANYQQSDEMSAARSAEVAGALEQALIEARKPTHRLGGNGRAVAV